MNRKRSVFAASGIAAVLIAGTGGLAFANGIFATRPVDRVGSFQSIEARLALPAAPPPATVHSGAPVPGSVESEPSSPAARSTTTVTTARTTATATTPTYPVPDTTAETAGSGGPVVVSTTEPVHESTSVPKVGPPPTTKVVRRATTSTTPGDDTTDGRGLDN